MPVPVMATVPLVGWVIAVMVRVSPGSGSVSLANTLIALAVESSVTVVASSTAIGGIVDRGDGDGDVAGVGQGAVGEGVVEAGGAGVVGGGGEGDLAGGQ